jgi:hypothetical protein
LKEIYILATEGQRPIPLDELREPFESEDVDFIPADKGTPWSFDLKAEESHVRVRFESLDASMGWSPNLLTGSDEAHQLLRKARGFYRIEIEPGKPQGSVAVFEALWTARALMERIPGVLLDITAFKLHEPTDVEEITELEFDIRDHVNLHAVQATDTDAPLWVHSHGLEKFGSPDVEMFGLGEKDLAAAEGFLHELCTDLAFGQGPEARALVETSHGQHFTLLPSDEARLNLMGVPLDTFEGHETSCLTVVSPEGRHTAKELLAPYRERFEGESEERTQALLEQARKLIPSFKTRFLRKGLMEPLTFLVRAPFETHPDGDTVMENLWLEILTWEDDSIVGKLVDGAAQTTEWRKGAAVEVEADQVNAIALGRDGHALDDEDMRSLLGAELPS